MTLTLPTQPAPLDDLRRQSIEDAKTLAKYDLVLADLLDVTIRLHRERADRDTAVAAIDEVAIDQARAMLRERCAADPAARRWLVEVDGLGHLIEEVA